MMDVKTLRSSLSFGNGIANQILQEKREQQEKKDPIVESPYEIWQPQDARTNIFALLIMWK